MVRVFRVFIPTSVIGLLLSEIILAFFCYTLATLFLLEIDPMIDFLYGGGAGRIGLVVSSILFAMSHFSYGLPSMIVGVFTISLIIGRTFARSGDLLPCIIAHGVFDAVQLLVILPLAVRLWPEPAGVTAVISTIHW